MPVRDLTPADLPRVLELNNAAVPAVGLLDAPGLARLAELAVTALVAEVDGEVVGFCIVLAPGVDYGSVNYGWFDERYDRFAYLDRVAIDPAFQGRGIGRELYDRVEAEAITRGDADLFCLEINVRPRNDTSLAFHERLGFTEVGQQETPYGARVSLQTRPIPHRP